MDEFIRKLNADLDRFLAEMEEEADRAVLRTLDEIDGEQLEQSDINFWYIAVLLSLATPMARLETFLYSRMRDLSGYFGVRVDTRLVDDAMRNARAGVAEAAAGINSQTIQALITGLRGADLAAVVVEKTRAEVTKFAQRLDTVVSAADRVAVRDAGEKEGLGLWIYAGPADNRNRAFCADIVRRPDAYTETGIEKLNAHPSLHKYVPPNVRTLCGGFNCRHVWWPVSEAYVKANGLRVVK